ncbi:MAG TPA: HD domain-containing protein [Spirochaetales bacterium]|nr:HD domain-containing protein [Spirochaetales bacterium]
MDSQISDFETNVDTAVIDKLLASLSPRRRAHSISTATVAVNLCRRFGVDVKKGQLAGLIHDSMKERELSEQWRLAAKAKEAMPNSFVSRAIEEFEQNREYGSKMIHGPAAAGYLCHYEAWADLGALEAVALHSSAFTDMKPLCKIIYIADKLEPLREYVGIAEATALETEDLEDLFAYAVGHVVEYLLGKGYRIAQSTLDLYNSLTTKKVRA